ncbi:MAG: response regulator transcription factor [Bacteroidetes bacterium]|nr:response regulator transcription factor [Bacteroidota bacterium]
MFLAIGDNNELDVLGLKALALSMDEVDKVEVFSRSSELLGLKTAPQVILLDFSAENFGLESIQRIKEKFPKTHIVAITPIQSSNTILSAVKMGITAYVKKDCSIDEIKDSILQAQKGKVFFCGDILRLLDLQNIDLMDLEDMELSCAPVLLTDRETEILRYIAVGHTNGEIAEMLFLSSHTVNTHRKNILNKIGANNTAGAVLYAVKEGVIEPEKFSFVRN